LCPRDENGNKGKENIRAKLRSDTFYLVKNIVSLGPSDGRKQMLRGAL